MRGDRSIAILAGVLVALCLLLFHRGHFSSSDELGLFQTTRSMALEGSLAIPAMPNAVRAPDGLRYSLYELGQPVLALPLHELGRLAGGALPAKAVRALAGPELAQDGLRYGGSIEIFAVGLFSTLMTGVLVAVFYLFERRLGASPRGALLAALALGLTTHAALLSTYFLTHTSEAVAILAGFLVLFEWRRRPRPALLFAGTLLVASALLLRFPAVAVAPGAVLYVLGALAARRRAGERPEALLREVAVAAAAVALVLAVHAGVNHLKWGAWLEAPMLGESRRFPYPPQHGLRGFLVSPGHSIFVYSPLLLLLPWTFPPFRRAHGLEAATIATVFATYLVFFSLYDGWTGLWSAPGPRYLFATLPLLMLPLGPWLDRIATRRAWLAVAALAALGAFVQIESMATSLGELAQAMAYPSYTPKWSFLLHPDVAPPVATASFFLRGELNDMWIVRLARGWPGQAPAPGAAWLLAGVWLAAVSACAVALHRLVRGAEQRPA